MAARKGSLLEKQVESIFSSAGFDTETNKYHSGYEIDVYAELGDLDIVAECKQYENSNLSVRNLIHQWKGKNKSIEADVLVLVIYGQDITEEEKELAESNSIDIWDEEVIEDLLNMNDNDVKNHVFEKLPLQKNKDLGDSYETKIRKLIWKPYLANKSIDDDYSYRRILTWTKKRIRRELFQEGSTKKERETHINFFENVHKEGRFRDKVEITSSQEKFQRLADALQKEETNFTDTRNEQYKNYLRSLHETYEDAEKFYLQSEGREQLKRLIESRLEDVKRYSSVAKFASLQDQKPIKVTPENSKILLNFEIDDSSDLEKIRWILTKEGKHERISQKDENGYEVNIKNKVIFSYQDPEDAKTAILRVFDEYYNYNLQEMRVIDLTLLEEPQKKGLIERLIEFLDSL